MAEPIDLVRLSLEVQDLSACPRRLVAVEADSWGTFKVCDVRTGDALMCGLDHWAAARWADVMGLGRVRTDAEALAILARIERAAQ